MLSVRCCLLLKIFRRERTKVGLLLEEALNVVYREFPWNPDFGKELGSVLEEELTQILQMRTAVSLLSPKLSFRLHPQHPHMFAVVTFLADLESLRSGE